MKLILHIGMGKTGTSSIQTALRTSTEELKAQKVHYLGMWFDAIYPAFQGHAGLLKFLALDETEMQNAAKTFIEHLKQQAEITGADTFILSNEGIFGNVHYVTPFLHALQPHVDISVVAYIRNPYKWLPSAFTQWGLFHKQQSGPLQTFRERATALIAQYTAMPAWIEIYGAQLDVRKHDTSIDVVQDFCEVCGIDIKPPKFRLLERSEPAEILLRAAFNGRYQSEVFPERFNRIVMTPKRSVVSMEDMTSLCFKYDGLEETVEARRELFETIRNGLGPDFDFISESSETKSMPDLVALQRRLIDHLVEISFQQGERLAKLEQRVQELTENQ